MLVAVYGSLRKGMHNHPNFLKDAEYLGKFETDPVYTMYDVGSYPGVVEGGNTPILCEVYRISPGEISKNIDMLEGYQGSKNAKTNHYNRKGIRTPYGAAFLYIYNRKTDKLKKVPSGDWVEYNEILVKHM